MVSRISQQVIREVIARTDMRAVVSEAVRLSKAGGGSLKGLCPFHNEKTPSFTINLSQRVYYCHGCGAGGDVISFVRETRGLHFGEAVEWLADRAGVRIEHEDLSPADQRRRRQERSERSRLLDLNAAALAWFQRQLEGPAGGSARAYLRERGLSDETVARFGVGCAPDSWDGLSNDLMSRGFGANELLQLGLSAPRRSGDGIYDRFRDRLMFPVYSAMGDLIAFGGRDLGGTSNAKYMNSPESELLSQRAPGTQGGKKFYKKSHEVYGLSVARKGIRTSGVAVLVEGNLDVMMLHQYGVTNAVCPMGTALTVEQLAAIKRFGDRVALVFDGDKAGRAAMMKAVPRCLEAGLDGVYVVLPDGEDPDSLLRTQGLEAWDQLLHKATNLITGWVDAMVQQWDGTIRGKAEILEQVGPILATIHEPISRQMAQDYLGTRLLSSDIEDNLRPMRDYLSKTRPPRSAALIERPAPVAGPPVPPAELELARAMMWYPHLLADLARVQALDLVTHVGMREALQHLCSHAAAVGEVHSTDLPGWLTQLPDDAARRGLRAALAQPPRVNMEDSVTYLEHVIDRLEIADLQAYKLSLDAQVRRASDDTELIALSEKMQAVVRRIRELNREMIAPNATDADASAPAEVSSVPAPSASPGGGATHEGSVHV